MLRVTSDLFFKQENHTWHNVNDFINESMNFLWQEAIKNRRSAL